MLGLEVLLMLGRGSLATGRCASTLPAAVSACAGANPGVHCDRTT